MQGEAYVSDSPRGLPLAHIGSLPTHQARGLQQQPSTTGSSTVINLAQPLFNELCNEEGQLPARSLHQMLEQLSLSTRDVDAVVRTVVGPGQGAEHLTKDQTMAVLGLIHSSQNLAACNSNVSLGSPSSSPSKAPLKKVLTKNRSYLETGSLSYDEAIVTYLTKLDEHRKKCEADGRYQEARAAALRLADIKTAQVERLRGELVVNQGKELEEVQRVFQEETEKFTQLWDARIREYESALQKAVADLKGLQETQRAEHMDELLKKRPQRPKPSKEYLNQKKIEVSMAKSRQYLSAEQVRAAADELYAVELAQTQQAFEAGQRLKLAKFTARQKQEFDALLQRGARGRDELELRRVAETERRLYRFRNVVAELENLHRLEVVQLESFLDAQVQAGKAVPLKDDGAFRRRRETL